MKYSGIEKYYPIIHLCLNALYLFGVKRKARQTES
jgi:hypothetical protein